MVARLSINSFARHVKAARQRLRSSPQQLLGCGGLLGEACWLVWVTQPDQLKETVPVFFRAQRPPAHVWEDPSLGAGGRLPIPQPSQSTTAALPCQAVGPSSGWRRLGPSSAFDSVHCCSLLSCPPRMPCAHCCCLARHACPACPADPLFTVGGPAPCLQVGGTVDDVVGTVKDK